ncbi:MAG: hypothetical protein FWC16_14215 [Defluviitaleaceae bacterium]|nr:hypothetical protein [Defluviitaleaceae bacterium]MCL2276068.1 hypothetical protein [Defluviitaleaceae bacterium]
MEHLCKKPFFLTDEDVLWVGNTLADMTQDQKIARLMYAPGDKIPFSPIGRMSAERVKIVQNSGFAAYVTDFPGDEVDERDIHLVAHINTLSCAKWDKTFGESYRACIEAGVLAVMVEPIIFPAYSEKLGEGKENAQPASRAPEIVTALLKEQLGFNGLVVAENMESEDMPYAIAAGCDMLFSSGNVYFDIGSIKRGLKSGIISQDRLHDALTKVLGIEAALGLHK